ncbi:MAG: putative Ig domain-containing protein [Candidatus Micrarchaeota archaeon]|nr:putative Ig domain-containing protein [Candidatus Micrarchaeota archaeon]
MFQRLAFAFAYAVFFLIASVSANPALQEQQAVVADGESPPFYDVHYEIPAYPYEREGGKRISDNLPPVITAISGPSSLSVGQSGTWIVYAYDPEGGQLRYYVRWGDENMSASIVYREREGELFTHAYYVPGTYYPTFRVFDNQNASASASISVVVVQPFTPYIMPQSLPNGTIGIPYKVTLWTNLDTANWSVSAGSLPPGLYLSPDASTAKIQGVPNSTGLYSFVITAVKGGLYASRSYTVRISPQAFSRTTCAILPSSLSLPVNSTARLQVKCYARYQNSSTSEIACPEMFWTSNIGVVEREIQSNGTYANFFSGSLPGSGEVVASDANNLLMPLSSNFACSIPVFVFAAANNSTGGGNGGAVGAGGGASPAGGGGGGTGGSTRVSTQLSVACAGQPSAIKVNYYSAAPSSQVEIYQIANGKYSKVFSQTLSGASEIPFIAPSEGEYELRLSIGSEQKTSTFTVPPCSPQIANTTQTVTVNLAPTRELVLSKSVDYGNGFTKEFKVFRTTSGSDESFSTEVLLSFINKGNSTLQNLSIADSVPRSVVSRIEQIIFDTYPSEILPGADPSFSWKVRSLPSGGKATFSYRFNRAVTEPMLERFAAPSAVSAGQPARAVLGGEQAPADLLAANVSFAGLSIPVSILAVVLLSLVLIALIVLFIFSGKKEQ